MADQTLAALRELTEAVMAEFFGNDTNLSKRLIKATNEAQLLLMVQPPDDDLANRPAPVSSAELTDQELLRTYAAAKRNYRYEGPIDDWPRNEERALTVAGLRAVIAADRARRAVPPADHIPGATKMVTPTVAEIDAEWLATWSDEAGHYDVVQFARSLLAKFGQQPTPPAEGEVGELVAWLRSLVHSSISFESGSENTNRLVRAAYLLLSQSLQIAELQRQLRRSHPHA